MSRQNSFLYKAAALFLMLALIVPALAACGDNNEEKAMLIAAPIAMKMNKPAVAFAGPIITEGGLISGTVMGDPGSEVYAYRGVPYAAPPVGNLRWKPPQPVVPWAGTRECTKFSLKAPQELIPGFLDSWAEASEDCLYLNLYTPAKTPADRLPVMVWLGGGLETDSGNNPIYNTINLAQHGVVTVIVNSRLGALGYIALPELSKESAQGVSGNYGTLDLIAALKWVQKNITAFGGDPGRVTIFGEYGGGTKVISCMASPLAKGLFHRAIIQSGSNQFAPGMCQSLKAAEVTGQKLAAKLGVTGETDVLAALRAKSAKEIIEANGPTLIKRILGASTEEPVYKSNLTVDGWVLPDQVYNIFYEGKQNDVPLIIGANEGENAVLPTIIHGASSMSKSYIYVFSHMPTNWKKEGAVAPQGIEVPYVFHDLDAVKPFLRRFPYIAGIGRFTSFPKPPFPQNQNPGLDKKDEWVSAAMMTMWTQFAATGDPSVQGLTKWPAYDKVNPKYLEIASPLQVKSLGHYAFR